jgi:sortase A
MRLVTYKRANNILFAAIFLVNGYVISAPFLPGVWYWWQTRNDTRVQQLTDMISATPKPVDTEAAPLPNTLIIPRMLIDTPIVEGSMKDSLKLLDKGAWFLPISSSPDKGGNTVIAGHRFSYTGPRGIFYYLNKLVPGDDIGIRWNGTMYHYTVRSSRTAASTEISVQEPTEDTRLTLYTCTPLWNPVNRLVVVATPEKENT